MSPPRPSAPPTSDTRGVFVTFEGVEGSGKSTQLERLADRLRRGGREVVVTREPGGTELGRRLRSLLLDARQTHMEPMVELLLYAADRAQHVCERIRPALERGALVLCDRFLHATLAYQGHGRGLDTALIMRIHSAPPLDLRPDRTILLDLDPTHGLPRAVQRNLRSGTGLKEGRFEAEALAFHRRVREGYLALARAEPERFRVVPAIGDPDTVASRVWEAVADLVGPTERQP